MVEEFIELMGLGVIHLPREWNGSDFIRFASGVDSSGEEILKTYELSDEEKMALTNIDLAKIEITSIHKTQNPEKTTVSYALAKDKENKMHELHCAYAA